MLSREVSFNPERPLDSPWHCAQRRSKIPIAAAEASPETGAFRGCANKGARAKHKNAAGRIPVSRISGYLISTIIPVSHYRWTIRAAAGDGDDRERLPRQFAVDLCPQPDEGVEDPQPRLRQRCRFQH